MIIGASWATEMLTIFGKVYLPDPGSEGGILLVEAVEVWSEGHHRLQPQPAVCGTDHMLRILEVWVDQLGRLPLLPLLPGHEHLVGAPCLLTQGSSQQSNCYCYSP